MEGGGLLWELVQVKLQLRRLHKTLIESSRLWPKRRDKFEQPDVDTTWPELEVRTQTSPRARQMINT